LEAETIAAWLAAHKAGLESTYGKPLHEIVGVVTPFSAQARAIAQACEPLGIAVGSSEGEMTVGTVHSLQGAERRVVIFSPVYSKHADGKFIDARLSMLNVAASRAKNTFLVFGDMDLFELVPRESPRGQLAALLFSDDAYELRFDHKPRRRDLVAARAGITQLLNAGEHDAFLLNVLGNARHEVHIVTPWIRLECIQEETDALDAMAAAVENGLRVHVYTDYGSNIWARERPERQRKENELKAAVDALKARNIDVVLLFKVHSKIVIGDDSTYCVGSFNWFSAQRDERARHETSLVYRGTGLKGEIETVKTTLAKRVERFARF
jgi:AAA domain-containing protein/phospholipase D-like protein